MLRSVRFLASGTPKLWNYPIMMPDGHEIREYSTSQVSRTCMVVAGPECPCIHGESFAANRMASIWEVSHPASPSRPLPTNFGLSQWSWTSKSLNAKALNCFHLTRILLGLPHWFSFVNCIKWSIMPDAPSITDAEWEVHKKVIGRLYQDKPLHEVMSLMEQDHGFVAKLVTQIPIKLAIELTLLVENLNTSENSNTGTFQNTLRARHGHMWLKNWRKESKKAKTAKRISMGNWSQSRKSGRRYQDILFPPTIMVPPIQVNSRQRASDNPQVNIFKHRVPNHLLGSKFAHH